MCTQDLVSAGDREVGGPEETVFVSEKSARSGVDDA